MNQKPKEARLAPAPGYLITVTTRRGTEIDGTESTAEAALSYITRKAGDDVHAEWVTPRPGWIRPTMRAFGRNRLVEAWPVADYVAMGRRIREVRAEARATIGSPSSSQPDRRKAARALAHMERLSCIAAAAAATLASRN